MVELEQICEDVKSWLCFEGETKDESIWVYCRCPECGKWVKRGQLFINLNCDIKLKGFICKQHGEIDPFHIVD